MLFRSGLPAFRTPESNLANPGWRAAAPRPTARSGFSAPSRIGVTRPLFSEIAEDEFDVYLSVNGPSGFETEKVEAHTIAPHLLVPPSARVTLQATRDAFVTRGETASRRRFLTGKTVWATTVERVGDWDVNVYGVMFPDNDALQTLSRDVMGVPVSEQDYADGSALLQNGIFVGTKGMPTGMKLAPKPNAGRYPAYYKRCYFFVESPHLKFDLGRKSLHYRHTSKLQSAVAQLFASFEEGCDGVRCRKPTLASFTLSPSVSFAH